MTIDIQTASPFTPVAHIEFPAYSGLRCLMMPYIQGMPSSVPKEYEAYYDILSRVYVKKYGVGYLTIDESPVRAGLPHRGARAMHGRALHTEVGRVPGMTVSGGGWGSPSYKTPDKNVFPGGYKTIIGREAKVLIANSIDNSCAVWNTEHLDTTPDGDIGHYSYMYPYETATMMKAGDVHAIGPFTPHESMPIEKDGYRQFIRIVGQPVSGGEDYFTKNPLMEGEKYLEMSRVAWVRAAEDAFKRAMESAGKEV